jgi:hypothetical protein
MVRSRTRVVVARHRAERSVADEHVAEADPITTVSCPKPFLRGRSGASSKRHDAPQSIGESLGRLVRPEDQPERALDDLDDLVRALPLASTIAELVKRGSLITAVIGARPCAQENSQITV